jgi:hypothetical protein
MSTTDGYALSRQNARGARLWATRPVPGQQRSAARPLAARQAQASKLPRPFRLEVVEHPIKPRPMPAMDEITAHVLSKMPAAPVAEPGAALSDPLCSA